MNAIQEIDVGYLCAIDKERKIFLTIFLTKSWCIVPFMVYIKELCKSKSKSLHLIGILEDFANDDNEPKSESEELDKTHNDKKNTNVFQL